MLHAADSQDRLNDFVIKLANVNGTGSASANTLLMKSIFRMGIPVVGKNYFPSNIQGLPTWYEIRVTRDGYVARSGRVDIMVAMNAETYARDLREVSPGGYLIYDSTWPRAALLKRDDITILGAPFARLCNETFQGVRSRILLKNIMYAGYLGALLDIDMDVMRGMLGESYATKKALLGLWKGEGRTNFVRNLKLMSLLSVPKPAPETLTIDNGSYNPDAFKAICERLVFASLLKDFDNFVAPFQKSWAARVEMFTDKEAA